MPLPKTTKTIRNTVSGLETHQPITTSTWNNSSAFKFLTLPPELRNMIYRELFTPNSSAPRGSHPQILASCHQIFNKAIELFYTLTQIRIDIHPWFVGFNNEAPIRFYQQNKCLEVQRYLYVCDNLSIRIVTTQHPGSQSLYTEHCLDPLLGEKVRGLVGEVVVYNKELKSIHINLEVRNEHLLSSCLSGLTPVYEASVLRSFKKLRGIQDVKFSGHIWGLEYAERVRERMMLLSSEAITDTTQDAGIARTVHLQPKRRVQPLNNRDLQTMFSDHKARSRDGKATALYVSFIAVWYDLTEMGEYFRGFRRWKGRDPAGCTKSVCTNDLE